MPQLALLLTLVCLLISIPIASFMGESLHKQHPDLKPYKWGYLNGWMGVFIGSVTAFLGFIKLWITYDDYPNNHDVYVLFLVLGVLVAISGKFIIERNKWGWVAGIILQFNLILWIINGIYVKNRWSELSGPSLNAIAPGFNKKSLAFRALVVGSAFWVFVVLVFVYVFKPFGSYVSNEDWWQVTKIIVFPPLVAKVGYFLYAKLVQPQKY